MGGDVVLKRPSLQFDQSDARCFFRERSVLVTGGAGSIGAELCRSLADLGCPQISILDHFDHALLAVCEEVRDRHPKAEVIEILADIREPDRIEAWFRRVRPDIVVNAAALKHVHLGERHPVECIRTNLFGMRNVLRAASASGARTFLQISTDKAAAPVCVMGASKRLAELHLWGFERECANAPAMKAVRFGNVLGSQGSVVPRFQQRIEEGRNLEVTHPDMRRFFMTSGEAIQFIIHVAHADCPANAAGYFLDMGEPMRIVELAKEMLAQSKAGGQIVFTSLREGEKLGEALFDDYETVTPSGRDKVYRLAPRWQGASLTSAHLAELEATLKGRDGAQVTGLVFALLDERLGRRDAAPADGAATKRVALAARSPL